MVEVVEPIGNLMIGFKWTAPFVHLQVITLFKCTRMQINKAFGLQAIMKAIQINSCDTDGDWGCCDLNNYYSDFSGDRCYPYWYRLEANCGGETDWMEIVYNGARVNGDSYKCSNYDNCKGFWYGDNCQYYVAPYNENTECKVSMGREGNGHCFCFSASSVQSWCRSGTSDLKIKYYWREQQSDDWTDKQTLDSISLTSYYNFYNQYNISGYIMLPDENYHYSFQLTTQTPPNLTIGTIESDQSNFLNCDPTYSYTHTIDYGKPEKAQPIRVEIIIDTGCSLNS